MDQINDSKYPSHASNCTVASVLFTIGITLFIGSSLHYIIFRHTEFSMVMTAYSFFFFLGSAVLSQYCLEEGEEHDAE